MMTPLDKIRNAISPYMSPWVREFGGDALLDAPWSRERIISLLNFLLPVFAGLYVFLSPLPYSTVTDLFFYFSLATLLILLVSRKTSFTIRFPVTLPLMLFFIWAFIGLFWALDFENSIHDLRAHFLEYIIIFYLLVNYFNSAKKLEGLSRLLIAGVVVFSLQTIIRFYFVEGFPFTERLGYTFAYTHTNYIGFMNVTTLPLALHAVSTAKNVKSRLTYSICIAFMCLTVLLTQSRGALISMFAGMIILCFNNKKIFILILPAVLALLLLPGIHNRIAQQGFTEDVRSKINRLTLEVIKDHPVTGIGFGMQIYGNRSLVPLQQYNEKLPDAFQQRDKIYNSTHNSFLDITVRTGVVGLALHAVIISTFFMMIWRTYRRTRDKKLTSWAVALLACLISSLTASLFEDVTFGAPAVIQYSILAMITILWNLGAKDPQGLRDTAKPL